ncbi:autotransporter assembly complex protein TamB [Actinobacillus capsulatus]|uniref:autotransporter assembly complex protein TamB n=1 Tax=Actinobacillus capsulatus TaxID=717 RepID=UPI0003698524|nr:translocation/assembly module TamB domain-containing protein [Actinobacillus capsulatus]
MSEQHKQQVERVQSEQQTQITIKKNKWRWLRYVGCGLLWLILIPLLFLMTGKGQRTVFELADKWLEQLTIGNVKGSLQDGLTLSDTKFVMDGVDVSVGQADLHIGFRCFLTREACLENLALKDITVVIDTAKLPPSQADKDSEPFTELNLPLGVSAKKLALDNIQVKVDEMDIGLTHFHSGISGKGRAVNLVPTELDGLTLSLAPASAEQAVEKAQEIAKKSEKQTASSIDWAEIKAKLAQPLLTKQAPIRLPLDAAIPQLEAKNIHIEQKVKDKDGKFVTPQSIVKVESLLLQAKVDQQSVELSQLLLKSDRGNVSGNGLLILAENYPLKWSLNADSPLLADLKIPASQVKAELKGELFGKTSLDIQTNGAVKANLKGEVQLAKPKTPLNLHLTSDAVSYPFIPEKGQEPLKLEKIDLLLRGDVLNYQLDTQVSATGMGIPASRAHLKGQGEITQFNIEQLALNALEGKANLSGNVNWENGVAWDAKTDLDTINTKSLAPEWAAVLSGGLQSKGYAGRGENGLDWHVEVSNLDLNGMLLQKNLQLNGEIKSNNKTLLDVPSATLIYGENNIALKGILSDKSDFSAQINAPNLTGLLPKLAANIQGNVKLTGKVAEPNLDLDLTAKSLSYDQLNLQNLIAKGKVTTEKTIQGNVDISLAQLAYGDVKVENASLVASGNEANHSLKLNAKGNPIGADLQLSGKFDRLQQVWRGQLSQVAIDSKEFGLFKTNQAVNVSYDNKQINANVSAHCWHNPKINLCFPQAFNAGQEGKVPFEIKQFNLAAIQEFLDKNTQLSGVVNAKGDAAWFKNKQPQVNVELDSNALKLVQKLEGGNSFPLTLSPVKVNANLADNNLKLKTDIKIENNGRLTTDLLINDAANSRKLSGNIHIDQLTLRLIKPLLTGGESVDGNINARLTVGGAVTAPLLNGTLNLTELRAKANAMPFDVTGGHLALNFHGATSTLAGRVQTTESELRLDGDADWRRLDAWKTRVHAQANRFRVNVPNMAKVEFSPNIEVTATPRELILGGNIDIPWARIAVESLPESAVSVSSDEVIMDGSVKQKVPLAQRQIPQKTASGMAIKANININIGNDVSINAYGLKSHINGTIAVRQGKQGLGLYGQVNLKNGRYASFGQDLLIRKGVISFAGLPSQPTLNIEAIRNPEAMEDPSVTAGVKVIGLADSPEVKVFSEPSMSQNEALSYVLTGRSLDNSGDSGSSNSMAAALIGMSLSKSSKTVGAVGNTFGLNDLNVTTAGIGDNTKVEVSASLTPKFKVKYGVGIFAALTELTLRYNLAPRLYLQWVSSVNQAVDLMYRFEFDEMFK